ncbi:MAG: penicillin-binding protein 1C [Candidatus Eremiobacteraeota bacterium]|nr:penicillin-binding protein 1C [Candidatus Eremiobacteraeota bacterium]
MRPKRRWLLGSLLALGLAFYRLPMPDVTPANRLELLDRQGRRLRADDNLPVPLQQISPWLVQSTLAAEDQRFYAHWGVDAPATLAAAYHNLRAGRVVAGGSTLTQQLIANLNGRPRGWLEKAWQSLQALRLERSLSKPAILEHYLNRVPYSNNTFGAESAARFYFGRPAASLSLAQAALLAGIPRGPDIYNPLLHFEKARERQHWVLKRMLTLAWIDTDQYRQALAEPLPIKAHHDPLLAPHFCRQVERRLPPGSGRVQTTLDGDLQREVEGIVRTQVELLRRRGLDGAAVVVLDNAGGEVRALVGSPDFRRNQVDLSDSPRQPGSALKPFTYGMALESGLTPASLIPDLPVHYATSTGDFAPTNYDGTFHGPVRLRTALASSYNVPAVRLAHRVGVAPLLQRLHKLGLDSLDQSARHYGLSLTLGGGEVTLLELTRAYMALANGGQWRAEVWVRGRPAQTSRRVFSPQTAFLLSDILKDPAARAPAFGHDSVLALPFDCAVKTGTSREYSDNWTLGYSTRYTVGVWAGPIAGGSMQDVSGVAGAGPIFREVMLALHRSRPPQPFTPPPGLVKRRVCSASGQLPGAHCQGTLSEWFTRPTQETCAMHRASGPVYGHDYAGWARPQGLPVEAGLHIQFPQDGDTFVIDPRLDRRYQTLQLQASGGPVHWTIDGLPVEADWPLHPGPHRIQARTPEGATQEVHITVRAY